MLENIEKLGSGGTRTHASEETGGLNQRLRPLGHATLIDSSTITFPMLHVCFYIGAKALKRLSSKQENTISVLGSLSLFCFTVVLDLNPLTICRFSLFLVI